jgi:hypothetical protein
VAETELSARAAAAPNHSAPVGVMLAMALGWPEISRGIAGVLKLMSYFAAIENGRAPNQTSVQNVKEINKSKPVSSLLSGGPVTSGDVPPCAMREKR